MHEITEATRIDGELPKLRVRGSVLVYTRETEVKIVNLRDTDPTICSLLLSIIQKEGPMKGHNRPFCHEEEGRHVSLYSDVKIIVQEGGVSLVGKIVDA